MKYPVLTALLTVAAAINIAAAEQPPAGNAVQDAELFAGRTDEALRYLRLGELALEKLDAASAVRFLKQSLALLTDPAARRQAIDLLQEGLLADRRIAEADILLDEAQKAPEFADHKRNLELMQARGYFYDGKLNEAINICRNLTARLENGDQVCLQALSLLGRALGQQGDYRGAQKCFADMTAAAGGKSLWQYKAMEGLIFNAVAAGDIAEARQAYSNLSKAVLPELGGEFNTRLQKLNLLIECAAGSGKKLTPVIDEFMKKTPAPDPLLARIAAVLAENLADAAERVKFAESAYKFAETAFRENALSLLIAAENAAGNWQTALTNAQKYLQDYPGSLNRWQMQSVAGNLCYKLGRTDDAINRFRKLFDDDNAPRRVRIDAAISLAKLYQKSQRVQDAAAMFKFVIAAPEITAAERSDLQQQLGEYYYQLGRYNEAAGCFAAAAAAGKDMLNSALWHAQTLYQLKKYLPSRAELGKVLQSSDENLKRKALYLDAMLEEKIIGSDAAIPRFTEFARKYPQAPEAPEALFHAGLLAMHSSRFEAAAFFREFARKYPGEQAANALYKALVELLANRDEKAAGAVQQELQIRYPDSNFTIGGYFQTAAYLRMAKRGDEALNVLKQLEEKYITLHAELLPEILYERACIYQNLNDLVKMREALEVIAQQHSKHRVAPQAFFMLGDLFMQQQKYSEALAAFKQACEGAAGVFAAACTGRAADAAYALYTRTRQEQHLNQAREGYTSLLKLPSLPTLLRYQSLYKLGRCLEDADDKSGALHCYRELLYQAVLAKREKRFYPPRWSAKAADSALKIVRAAIREDADSTQAAALQREVERLLRDARELNLPGTAPDGVSAEIN